jgi:hypothetical protein
LAVAAIRVVGERPDMPGGGSVKSGRKAAIATRGKAVTAGVKVTAAGAIDATPDLLLNTLAKAVRK